MPPTSPRPRRRRHAFTLIELILVITVMGILAAIAAPRIDVTRFHVDGGMHAATTTFLAAQREAVSRQHNVLVLIDTTTRALRLVWDTDNDERVDPAERTRTVALDPRVAFGLPARVPRRVAGTDPLGVLGLCGDVPCVVFQRNGSADRTATLFVTSERARRSGTRPRDARQIEVVRASGRPQSWTWTGSAWRRVD